MRESTRCLGRHTIAYITPEVAIDQSLATYGGGLGFLAGAMGRGAFQLGVKLITVAPLWRFGYYNQTIVKEHPEFKKPWMGIEYIERTYENILEDTGISIPVMLAGVEMRVKVWRLPQGELNGAGETIFLDTFVPENDWLSQQNGAHLYPALIHSGTMEDAARRRIAQSIVLGYGAVEALKALGYEIDLWHLNEGYAAFVITALVSQYLSGGLSLQDAVSLARKKAVFTTHTPEHAGNPAFPYDSVISLLCDERLNKLLWDSTDASRWLNLTLFCLKNTAVSNAVSQKHGQVAQEMWPGHDVVSVTNGSDVKFWQHPDFTAADTKERLAEAKLPHKRHLIDFVAAKTGRRFSENVMTIVWARRFARYKRPNLIRESRAWLEQLLRHNRLQIIFAGKPHPDDQEMIALWSDILNDSTGMPNLVVLPGYELELSRILKCGADLWLNTPRPKREASGTSGHGAAMNGALNCSTVDGWMCEADRDNFFPFGVERATTIFEQDAADAAGLREVIDGTILPMYMTDKSAWYEMALRAKREAEEHWSATRMIEDYCERVYGKVLRDAEIIQFQPLQTAA